MVRKQSREVKLPYVQEYRDRHGKLHRYFRRQGFLAAALPLSDKAGLEFLDAYREALERTTGIGLIGADKRSLPDSVSAVLVAYYDSPLFRDKLRSSSQTKRRRILEVFRRECGEVPINRVERRHLEERLGKLKPGARRNWLISLQQFFRFACDSGRCKADPTIGIKQVKAARKSGDDEEGEEGIQTWPEEWIAQFEAHWPIDTKERLAMALPLFTAQRHSDVMKIGKQMVKDGVLSLRQEKTGMWVHVPIDPRLAEIIAANGVANDMVYLKSRLGKSYSDSAFNSMFRRACDAAGLPMAAKLHGLRKAWCRRAADRGLQPLEIMAVTGHETDKEVIHYCKMYNRRLAAQRAIAAVAGGR